ncbi:putative methyltransferase YcgJ [bacterium HR19]|nr:putative methyltransferase YcgJ [bacterium HR19]
MSSNVNWRDFFSKLYQSYKPDYVRSGYGSEFALFLRKLVVKRAEEKFYKNGLVLDIGCGIGNFSQYFPKEKYVGIDIVKKAVQEAREKHNLNLLLSDAQKLPFKKESFSFVTAVEVLQYIEDKNLFFEEVLKVMKDDAKCILITQNPDSIIWRLRMRKRGRSPLLFASIEEVERILGKERIMILGGIYTPFDLLLFFSLPNFPKGFVKRFAKSFYIVFRK